VRGTEEKGLVVLLPSKWAKLAVKSFPNLDELSSDSAMVRWEGRETRSGPWGHLEIVPHVWILYNDIVIVEFGKGLVPNFEFILPVRLNKKFEVESLLITSQ
jgi:hypothetical protein